MLRIAERAKLPAGMALEAPALAGRIGLVWFALTAGVPRVWFGWEYWMEKAKGYLQYGLRVWIIRLGWAKLPLVLPSVSWKPK